MTALDLRGKSALVTGGARRIGRAIAMELARAGADVAVTYRSSRVEAEQTAELIAELGVRGFAVECDVRSEASVKTCVSQAASRLGGIDVLVNSAAIFDSAPIEELEVEAWDRVFETNARGPFLVARAALPWLRQARGRIINLGSLGGLQAWPTHAHYCSSKAALHMLTQVMARAFAPEVSVNCVAPGWIDADGDAIGGERSAYFAAKTPLERNGTPEDVAQTVLFLAAGPSFVTGQILSVDGGLGLL
jgi:3-oxoacyl-[acyl-carrier protein] reductase/pteridine reductase